MASGSLSDPSHTMLPGQHSQLTQDSAGKRDVVALPAPEQHSAGAVISRIEDILGSVQVNLLHGQQLSIPYRSRPSGRQAGSGSSSGGPSSVGDTPSAVVRFPGSTPHEAKKFARLMRLMQLIHDSLVAGTVLTKRNIYYQDVDLFGTQAIVDRLVDDLAYTLGFGRHELNIVAAAKGLLSGPITIHSHADSLAHASSSSSGAIIPPLRDIRSIDFGPVRWILVIEKEATFRSLSAARYWRTSASGAGIIVTGKGYPDLITRSFLHMVHGRKPDIPMYALVDFDPDGVNIMRCYKHGSRGLDHESNVKVPRLRWLGIKSCDIVSASSAPDTPGSSNGQAPAPSQQSRGGRPRTGTTCPLSARDRKCAVNLLRAIDETSQDIEELECRRELQIMMVLGVKAEIQAVDNAGDVTDWLDRNMGR